MPPRKRVQLGRTSEQKLKRTHLEKPSFPPPDPSHTLYITNLNTHITATKLKQNLYILFSTYADVIKIHYPRKGYRGQGWVVFSSADEAAACLSKLEGVTIFERDMRLQWARHESSVIKTITGNSIK